MNAKKRINMFFLFAVFVLLNFVCCSGYAFADNVSKTVTPNGDGTYNVMITASPSSREIQTTSTEPQQVILVIDNSGSMSNHIATVIDCSKNLAKTILEQNAEVELITYESSANNPVQLTLSNYESTLGSMNASGGTSFVPPLTNTLTVINDSTVKNKKVIFLTDGTASDSDDANTYVQQIVDAGATFYVIDVDSGGSTVLQNYVLLNKDADTSKYYYTPDNASLTAAFNDITSRISTTTITCEDFNIVNVLPEWTMMYGDIDTSNAGGNATSNGKTITWSIPSSVETNKTYSINFNVYPTQEAYDQAAASKNGKSTGSASDKGFTTASGGYGQLTDVSCVATYNEVTTIDGTTTTASKNETFPSGTMPLVLPKITVLKKWEGDGPTNGITADILEDGTNDANVILDDSNSWSDSSYYASPGLQVNGTTLNVGHSYSVKEEEIPKYYDASYNAGHQPMLVNNTVSDFELTVTNTYNAPIPVRSSLTDQIPVIKKLKGRELTKDDIFEFELTDENNDVVATGTNDADGNVMLSSITYDTIGTYVYTLKEKTGDIDDITYDESSYEVTAVVTDIKTEDGGNTFEVTWNVVENENASSNEKNEDDTEKGDDVIASVIENITSAVNQVSSIITGKSNMDSIVFENIYTEPNPVLSSPTDQIPFKKVLSGRELTENDTFKFELTDENNEVKSTGVNDANGNITMSEIEYGEIGTFDYTLNEVEGDIENITYDKTVYNLTATVTRDRTGNGNETAYNVVWRTDDGDIVFNNTYTEPPEEELVQTGDDGTRFFSSMVILASSVVLVCAFVARRRKSE